MGGQLKTFDVWMSPARADGAREWKVIERGPLDPKVPPWPFAHFVDTVPACSIEEVEAQLKTFRTLARAAIDELLNGAPRGRRRPRRRGR